MKERKFFSTRNVTYLAVLLAFVIVFQVLSSFMTIGNASFCLVLIPIVLGGMLLGWGAGAFLGLAFAIVVIISLFADPMSMIIMGDHPFFFPFSTLIRGVVTGIVPALLFKLVSKKNAKVATFVAAASAPIVNTGIFILSMLAMSGSLMKAMGDSAGGHSAFYVIIIMIVSFNFFIEFGLNIILSPAIFTITQVVQRRIASTAPVEDSSEVNEETLSEGNAEINEENAEKDEEGAQPIKDQLSEKDEKMRESKL